MTNTPRQSATPRVRLGGGDIGKCLTRLHHDRFTEATRVTDAVRDRAITRGIEFERDVVAYLDTQYDAIADLSGISWNKRAAATLSAIEHGAALILGGRLESVDGKLVGMPDLLIDDGSGYLAIDVKGHKVVGSSGISALYAPLDDLLDMSADHTRFRSHRRRDLLQVAHYRHLLQEMGFASQRPLGGIIGTDEPNGCAWVDLEAGTRSSMAELAMYLVAADEALNWGAEHGQPFVEPWMKKECTTCPWEPLCLGTLRRTDDTTLLRTVTAETRATLREEGIATVADVADLDLGSDLVEGSVILQARARTANALLRRNGDSSALRLPNAPIEVDLDLETLRDTTYLAGLLITDDSGTRYEPIADWTNTPEGERSLLDRLFRRFSEWARPDVVVFHWTGFEIDRLDAGAIRHDLGVPGWDSVRQWFDANAVDLCDWTRTHLVSPQGHGLKVIAPMCGFNWRDDDPGGLQSEIWFEELQAGNAAMKDRLLEYNEDDVIAQLKVREFLRRSDSGSGPGSALPSVMDWPPPGSATETVDSPPRG